MALALLDQINGVAIFILFTSINNCAFVFLPLAALELQVIHIDSGFTIHQGSGLVNLDAGSNAYAYTGGFSSCIHGINGLDIYIVCLYSCIRPYIYLGTAVGQSLAGKSITSSSTNHSAIYLGSNRGCIGALHIEVICLDISVIADGNGSIAGLVICIANLGSGHSTSGINSSIAIEGSSGA